METFPFTIAPVEGGWQIYDTERCEHIGHVHKRLAHAELRLESLRKYRPGIVRFILNGNGLRARVTRP